MYYGANVHFQFQHLIIRICGIHVWWITYLFWNAFALPRPTIEIMMLVVCKGREKSMFHQEGMLKIKKGLSTLFNFISFYNIVLSLRLEKTSKIIKSNPARRNHVLKCHSPFKYLQRWQPHYFLRQPVPMFDNPSHEETFCITECCICRTSEQGWGRWTKPLGLVEEGCVRWNYSKLWSCTAPCST